MLPNNPNEPDKRVLPKKKIPVRSGNYVPTRVAAQLVPRSEPALSSPLFEAIKKNDLQKVKSLAWEAAPSITCTNEQGLTPFFYSLLCLFENEPCDIEICKYLCELSYANAIFNQRAFLLKFYQLEKELNHIHDHVVLTEEQKFFKAVLINISKFTSTYIKCENDKYGNNPRYSEKFYVSTCLRLIKLFLFNVAVSRGYDLEDIKNIVSRVYNVSDIDFMKKLVCRLAGEVDLIKILSPSLSKAIEDDNLPMVEILVSLGNPHDPLYKKEKQKDIFPLYVQALQTAAQNGRRKILLYLIDNIISPHYQESINYKAQLSAIMPIIMLNEKITASPFLLEKALPKLIRVGASFSMGEYSDILEKILNEGVDYKYVLDLFLSTPYDFDSEDLNSILLSAINKIIIEHEETSLPLLEILLKYINQLDAYDLTNLTLSQRLADEKGKYQFRKIIENHIALINNSMVLSCKENYFLTFLCLASLGFNKFHPIPTELCEIIFNYLVCIDQRFNSWGEEMRGKSTSMREIVYFKNFSDFSIFQTLSNRLQNNAYINKVQQFLSEYEELVMYVSQRSILLCSDIKKIISSKKSTDERQLLIQAKINELLQGIDDIKDRFLFDLLKRFGLLPDLHEKRCNIM